MDGNQKQIKPLRSKGPTGELAASAVDANSASRGTGPLVENFTALGVITLSQQQKDFLRANDLALFTSYEDSIRRTTQLLHDKEKYNQQKSDTNLADLQRRQAEMKYLCLEAMAAKLRKLLEHAKRAFDGEEYGNVASYIDNLSFKSLSLEQYRSLIARTRTNPELQQIIESDAQFAGLLGEKTIDTLRHIVSLHTQMEVSSLSEGDLASHFKPKN